LSLGKLISHDISSLCDDWATANNLSLNIQSERNSYFVDKRRKHKCDTTKTLGGLRRRVQNIKILGITFTSDNGLSDALHVQQLVTLNAQALCALKDFAGSYMVCVTQPVQVSFRSVVLERFLYVSRAWWGFAASQDRQNMDFCAKAPALVSVPLIYLTLMICASEADEHMFSKVLRNPDHVLHCVPPPVSVILHGYSLRPRVHDGVLPDRIYAWHTQQIVILLFVCYFIKLVFVCLSLYIKLLIFGRPFVKQLALCYRSVVCLTVCLYRWCIVAKRLDGLGCHLVQG